MSTPMSREERWAAAENARRMSAYHHALAAWQADDDELAKMVATARSYPGSPTPLGGSPIVLKRNERAFAWIPAAKLVEVQRAPGQYSSGYSGFSFRITKNVRYSVGGARGTYVPGPEQMKITDEGSATVTNQRVVFTGSRNSREWAFGKLISVEHDRDRPITMIGVANRQKVSGIAHAPDATTTFRFNLGLALAHYRDDVPAFVAAVEAERAEHASARPGPPLPVTAADAPKGAGRALAVLGLAVAGKPSWPTWARAAQAVAVALVVLLVIGGIAGSGGSPSTSANGTPAAAALTTTPPTTTPPTTTAATTQPPATASAATSAAVPTHTQRARHRRAQPRHTAVPLVRPHRTVTHPTRAAPAPTRAPTRAPTAAATTAQHACTLTNSGTCIRGGEFCRDSDEGHYGYDADGRRYLCRDRHWEIP